MTWAAQVAVYASKYDIHSRVGTVIYPICPVAQFFTGFRLLCNNSYQSKLHYIT